MAKAKTQNSWAGSDRACRYCNKELRGHKPHCSEECERLDTSKHGKALTLEPNYDDLTREEEAEMVEADGDLRSAVESLGATFREIVVRTKCNNDRMRRNRGEIKHRALALIEQAKVLAGRC